MLLISYFNIYQSLIIYHKFDAYIYIGNFSKHFVIYLIEINYDNVFLDIYVQF